MTNRQKVFGSPKAVVEMERRVLYGLSLEYDQALSMLGSETASNLKKPLFRLSSAQRRLGSWHPDRREISISRAFVLLHSWGAVREVLHHEMAHQIADEIFGAKWETAHGPAFHRACELLKANPKASGNYPAIDSDSRLEPDSRHNRLLRKVKKLMALSKSENTHEAAAAMSKAHDLILKFNLPLLKDNRPASYITVFLGEPALRHYREDYHLAHLLQEFYFVEGLWVTSYVLAKEKMGRVLEISGTSTNVKIAAYVYDCVHHFIERQWKTFSSGQRLGRYRKSDFATGIITGFHQRLETERYRRPLEPSESALVLKGDPHLKIYMSNRYPHTRSIRSSNASMHLGVYNQGVAKGKRLSLFRGIEERASAGRRMLEE